MRNPIVAGLAFALFVAVQAAPRDLLAALDTATDVAAHAAGGECAWCTCCDESCQLMLAHTGPSNGISGPQFCDPEMCRIIGDCLIILDPMTADEPVIPVAVLAQLGGVVEAGDIQSILTLIDTYPSQVTVNLARSSVQVKRCGNYVANLPLTSRQIAEVIGAE
jgi:hypothetical protein